MASTPTSRPQKVQGWIRRGYGTTCRRKVDPSLVLGLGHHQKSEWQYVHSFLFLPLFTHIILPYLTSSLHRTYESSKEGLVEALDAPTREEFFSCIKAADPKVYITMYEKLEYYADKFYTPPVPEFTPKFTEFVRVPQEMREWVETEFHKVFHCTLILCLTHKLSVLG
jgi:Geminivirus rep protein central domain